MTRDEYLVRAREFASRGDSRPNAVLSPDVVRMVRADSRTAKELAAEIGCHYRTIEKVRQYETWTHIV